MNKKYLLILVAGIICCFTLEHSAAMDSKFDNLPLEEQFKTYVTMKDELSKMYQDLAPYEAQYYVAGKALEYLTNNDIAGLKEYLTSLEQERDKFHEGSSKSGGKTFSDNIQDKIAQVDNLTQKFENSLKKLSTAGMKKKKVSPQKTGTGGKEEGQAEESVPAKEKAKRAGDKVSAEAFKNLYGDNAQKYQVSKSEIFNTGDMVIISRDNKKIYASMVTGKPNTYGLYQVIIDEAGEKVYVPSTDIYKLP